MSALPSSGATIADLLALVPRGSAGFATEVGGWVLIGEVPELPVGWAFRTIAAQIPRAVRGPGGLIEAVLDPSWAAFVLKKRPGNGFAETIFLGRSTSNDVCLPHASVSKLHARVRIVPEGATLEDAGSSNGTVMNGDVVIPGIEVPLGSGDHLRFGAVMLQAFDPRRLFSVLERYMPSRKEPRL
ncbi:MAG: FHA domain-containing protein [Deltaproteobacteria bacterium]|nr:FHA domain-containing protein [Deltaproteobacteria bacterium]